MANIVSVMKTEDITAKTTRFKITNETKELLNSFVALFSTLQLERDTKIKNIDKKVTDLDNKTKAIQDKSKIINKQLNIRFLFWRKKYPHSRPSSNLKKIIAVPTSTRSGVSLIQQRNMNGVTL